MKFLVFGCNGMAGHMVSLYLKEAGHDVTGFARAQSKLVTTIVGDAQDKDFVARLIKVGKYDAVINCVGLLNQFAENNKALAVYINAFFPHFLADVTANMDTQIIHLSTDCVFSGKKGGYTETDFKDGETFYDRSKALGELDDNKNLTLRNSIVGPDMNASGIGLFNWFMQQGDSVSGYKGALWTGQTTLQLAKTMEFFAKERATGLYNTVPDHSICKYDLLKLFNHYFRNDAVSITAIEGVNADKSLKRTRYNVDYVIPDYEEMIKELAVWVKAHKHLYPHYKI